MQVEVVTHSIVIMETEKVVFIRIFE